MQAVTIREPEGLGTFSAPFGGQLQPRYPRISLPRRTFWIRRGLKATLILRVTAKNIFLESNVKDNVLYGAVREHQVYR